jgi:hypothetical protein
MTQKIIKFRIYPDSKHGLYFEVRIYPNLKTMRRACVRFGNPLNRGTDYYANAEAMTACHRAGYKSKRGGHVIWDKGIGVILFHRKQVNAETISHECTHAALRWAEERHLKLTLTFPPRGLKEFEAYMKNKPKTGAADEAEEDFAYAVGRMTNQIAAACLKHKLF